VLSLIVTRELFGAVRLRSGAMTKVRAQVVSGRACAEVARAVGVPERMERSGPSEYVRSLVRSEHALADVLEAMIGACYLAFGFERTAPAVVEAFRPRIREALEFPDDAKSELQELLARRGEVVAYRVTGEEGPPHDRTFAVVALVDEREIGRGSGRTKKEAEQAAARGALEGLEA
jgi:ribonuclease-3